MHLKAKVKKEPPDIYLSQKTSLDLNQKLGALAAFLIPSIVYIYYLCPTIAAGDSGEFITSAKILGIPHPPGYPLYTMIGHLFTWLPISSVAWRANLASALLSALTCLFVYLSLVRLTGRVGAALTGAWALAFSRFFWHYAEVAEVFALNNLFVAVITYVLILLYGNTEQIPSHSDIKKQQQLKSSTRQLFWLLSFLFGLALTNHHTIILMSPAVLVFVWFTESGFFRDGKTLSFAALFFFLGMTPYIYCPVAAAANPVINWDNPVTFKNFLNLFLRVDYGSFSPFATLADQNVAVSRLEQLPALFKNVGAQFTALGIVIAHFGFIKFRRRKIFQGYLSLGFFFSGIFFVLYANVPIKNPLLLGVLQRFYIMPAIFLSFWIGLGIENLSIWLNEKKLPPATRFTPAVFAVVLLGWQFNNNHEEADFRDNYIAENFAHDLLLSLPENAVFFVRGDVASMGVDYMQIVQGARPDVMTLDQAKLTYPWYYEQVKTRFPGLNLPGARYDGTQIQNGHLIAANINIYPVCFMDFKEQSYQQAFRALPVGLVYRMIPKSQSYSVDELEVNLNQLYAHFKNRDWQRTYPPTSFENEIKQIYAEPYFRLGYEFEQAGNPAKAAKYYKQALEINPLNHKVLKNLAVLKFYKLHEQQEAVQLFKNYLQMNPRDAEASNIRQVIESFEKTGNDSR